MGPPHLSMQGARDESPAVDHEKAKREAQELHAAGEKQWGTDESKFNLIIGSRSIPQLKATFDEYTKVSGCFLYEIQEELNCAHRIIVNRILSATQPV